MANIGKLWIPYACEVVFNNSWCTRLYQGGFRVYPCFQDGSQICKNIGETDSRGGWWTASTRSNNVDNFINITPSGVCASTIATDATQLVPLCMRFV